uniref:Endoplasmic reticulum-based factor for assembly of V-ATPase n=1 Tax=Rhodosorus marinus TaxID=101924 RepID=A0A7S2ZJE2_9RHOD|mmetsp:Transcript_21531/g.87841  ORF Transcript_21531/g.87841 Transcript_21531/m.87841 type:complete len:242 (+) Transcript_21531:2777-3502(+)|eukprot:CAMPEP_0113960558 /NCGR_PEP_ID=MMETSP0011_2-20120614/4779_1 /TAXON_ID=101924 /ORGANISM="Rhodosorus marinus" /LENGTH=241 /DNA_ID=CAMNT_0000972019 /DNA_START=259 /DNA_END=984 /DNA_ORIENTATION=+ /assembly_acc=CAM_ASM_000156
MVFVIVNKEIKSVLEESRKRDDVSEKVRNELEAYFSGGSAKGEEGLIHHRTLAHVCEVGGLSLEHLLSRTKLKLVDHVPRVSERPKELDERLSKLRVELERKQYEAMVKDVSGRRNDNSLTAGMDMVDLRNQTSVGLNVIVTMLTGYAVGHFLVRTYFGSSHYGLYGGLVGLIIGLGVEATLVITRIYSLDKDRELKIKRNGRGPSVRSSAAASPSSKDRKEDDPLRAAELEATRPSSARA